MHLLFSLLVATAAFGAQKVVETPVENTPNGHVIAPIVAQGMKFGFNSDPSGVEYVNNTDLLILDLNNHVLYDISFVAGPW